MSSTLPTRTVALVPARDGSVGLRGKNTKKLLGVPIYLRAVNDALEAGIDRVVISTDIDEILESADLPPQVSVHRRPTHLRDDDTPMDDVIADAITLPMFDDTIVVLLQPTSPLRTANHIRDGVEQFKRERPSLLMSVCAETSTVLKCGTLDSNRRFRPLRSIRDPFTNRQALPEVVRPNGAFYIADCSALRKRGELATNDISVFEMTAEESIDIDDMSDFKRCEGILLARERIFHANRA